MHFEGVMRGVFGVGKAVAASSSSSYSSSSGLAGNPDWQQYKADMAWWMEHKPEVRFNLKA